MPSEDFCVRSATLAAVDDHNSGWSSNKCAEERTKWRQRRQARTWPDDSIQCNGSQRKCGIGIWNSLRCASHTFGTRLVVKEKKKPASRVFVCLCVDQASSHIACNNSKICWAVAISRCRQMIHIWLFVAVVVSLPPHFLCWLPMMMIIISLVISRIQWTKS